MSAFEVMHPGTEDRFAVKRAPKTNGSELGSFGEGRARKVHPDFVRREVDVGEEHSTAARMLQNLGAPSSLLAGVEALARGETQCVEHLYQRTEGRSTAAK